MPDNLVLSGPQGSSLNIGSWLRGDPGADFGEKELLKAAYAENPLIDGAAYSFESVGVRRMSFPLYLASGGAGLSLAALQSALRLCARPNATLDVQLEGQASSEAIRFDVLGGRLEPEHNVRIWGGGGGRLPAVLKLDVQPLGYLPTWVTLASVAFSGATPIPLVFAASLLGDAPGYAQLIVQPTNTNQITPTSGPEGLLWSFGARASQFPFLRAASLSDVAFTGSTVTSADVPDEVSVRAYAVNLFSDFNQIGRLTIPAALEPAYRGRVHAYAYAVHTLGVPVYLSLDAVHHGQGPLASAAPIATVNGSGVYDLLDLGELTLPVSASGASQPLDLRLWAKCATTSPGVSTGLYAIAGLYLQPLDAGAGVLRGGLIRFGASVNLGGPSVAALALDSHARSADLTVPAGLSVLGNRQPAYADARQTYRGRLPYVGASVTHLHVLPVHRPATTAATALPLSHRAALRGNVSLRYRPRFAFLKGI